MRKAPATTSSGSRIHSARCRKSVACTEIYGGPEIADVQGTFRGKPVNTRFLRTNGCEIARWNRVRFLFPDT